MIFRSFIQTFPAVVGRSPVVRPPSTIFYEYFSPLPQPQDASLWTVHSPFILLLHFFNPYFQEGSSPLIRVKKPTRFHHAPGYENQKIFLYGIGKWMSGTRAVPDIRLDIIEPY